MMSNSEDDLSVTQRSLDSLNSSTSNRKESKVESRMAEQISSNDVENTDSITQPISTVEDGVTSDDDISPCTSLKNRSVRSVSSRESSQSSPTDKMQSTLKKRSIVCSSSSSESENDDTIVEGQKSSQSSSSPLRMSSQGKKLKSQNSSQSSAQTPPNNVSKSSLNRDSDEDVIASKKSKPMKLFESDENESDAGAMSGSGSSQKIRMSEENATDLEEPKQKKKKKKRLVLSSDSSDSNGENDATSSVIQNTYSEEKRDSEPESSNLTTKEKRRRRLEKLNEQKKCEFAKLVEKKKSRNSKKNQDDGLTHDNCEQPQPSVEELHTKPKKFLLLSDDDLSDSKSSEESLVDSENENCEKKKDIKSKKRKNNRETKNNSKSRKNQEKKLDGTEDAPSAKKQKKPRTRAPKSDATPKEPKQPKQKSKKQREAMLEIKSTTQKMIREGRIALPYHQPKQHSLDEFLQRRSDVPSIPLRASYDILSIAGERLTKKEEEIADFYKSESEHSEGEQIIDEMQNCETPHQNSNETNSLENCSIGCDNFLSGHDAPEVEALNNDKLDSLEEVSSAERVVSTINNVTLEEFDSLDCPSEMAGNSPGPASAEVGNDKSSVSQMDTFRNHDGEQTESTAATATDQNSLKVVESDSFVDSGVDSAPMQSDPIPKEIDESLGKGDGIPENINQVTNSHIVHEENIDVDDEMTILPRQPEIVAKENEVCSSEDVDSCAPAQDTEDILLEIENSCSAETNVQSSLTASLDPPFQADPEAIRRKKLELLSSRNVKLSDPKLKRDDNSIFQFEIDSVPQSAGIQSFMKKFASHVTAKKKTKKQSAQISVTNVQKDSQGEIIDIIKETLTTKSLDDDDDGVEDKFTLPGSRHSFFKDTMLKTLISKRTADWNKHQDEKYSSFDRVDGDCGDTDEEKDEEEPTDQLPNFEPYHPEDEPGDEDLVEDDVDMTTKLNKKKNEYVDEEAEVDFDEDENIMGASDGETDSEEECSVDDEEESQRKNPEQNDEDDSETDEKNASDKENEEEEVDSDEELLNSILKECEAKKSPMKETRVPSKLFKNNTTGEDLENKVLRLESGSQFDDFSNTQIFSICSGKFTTQIVPPVSNDTSQFLTDSQFPDDSQGFNLSMQETNDGFPAKGRDHETSSVVNKSSFLLSDDDSDTEELFNKKKKAAIQLEDSDNDESAKSIDDGDGEDLGNGNDPDENDAVEEEQEEGDLDEDDLDGELEYNSEEEIVDYKTTKPNEFFENEAELSESEWGSEDENEKDLDYMEKEAGDEDDIDNDRLKEELGRIHMRHLMDDDQKNVRLLQEILLEDGDLHADGQRNRKFQWKNLDGDSFLKNFFGDADDENALIDDNNDLNDDGKTKNWRQMRHEREMFLSKQEKNNDLLLSAEDEKSRFIRISSTVKVITKTAVSAGPLKSPNEKFSFHTKSKCGSFLSRGQQVLNRIANSVSESKESNIQGAKNSRNFVFAAKSVEEVAQNPATAENQIKKRKISSKSVMAGKRLKLVDGVSNQSVLLGRLE